MEMGWAGGARVGWLREGVVHCNLEESKIGEVFRGAVGVDGGWRVRGEARWAQRRMGTASQSVAK